MNEHFEARDQCPCCGGTTSTELCRTPYSDDPIRRYLASFYSPYGGVEPSYLSSQDYVVVECDDCNLIYQNEIPGDFLLHKIYEEWIDPDKVFDLKVRRREVDYFENISSEILRIIRLLARPPMELRFLDFGMGWGEWCRVAQSFGCSVHGTEFSTARIEYARSQGVQVIGEDEVALNRYDFINTEQVFEHLAHPITILCRLRDSLKPNGILKVSVPDGWDIKKRIAVWDWDVPKGDPLSLNPIAPLEHINCFDHSSLVRLGREAGLAPVEIVRETTASTFKNAAKSAIRPHWHRLLHSVGQPTSERKATYVLFQSANGT